MDPHFVGGELDRLGVFGDVVEDVVSVGGFDEFVGVVGGVAAGDVFVEEIGADKAGAFIRGGDPLDQAEPGM